ncbi:DUF397 domain-containing protein [Nocardia uniformis]|uniref:DUF397 domain-containing protein n=1 Tax=Nocardia uniformis TaxID=53432 RepID=A0A849C9D5_9NOCA|nr:DUF397 domain-containing protein [Nocardia uniformis]NNH72980.1 DUF397 domain-containing protein [Nocardia uniformis]
MSTTGSDTCRDTWFKSSFSKEAGTCVEVRFTGDAVLMRDSKYIGAAQDQPTIMIPIVLWPRILEVALSRSSSKSYDGLAIDVNDDGSVVVSDGRGVRMAFTADEWDAFAKGVADGQFDR